MLKLYLMEAEPLLANENRIRALELIERERIVRIERMKQEQARALSLAAGLLLAYAVSQEKMLFSHSAACQYEEKRPEPVYVSVEEAIAVLRRHSPLKTKKTSGGKPFLEGSRGLFFNLSHSGAYAACAVSDREVGLDIQQCVQRVNPAVVERVLHKEEKRIYANLPEKEKEAFFFWHWAAKEAYVKCTGEGLSNSFSGLLADWKGGMVTDTREGKSRKLCAVEAPQGYAFAVCTEEVPMRVGAFDTPILYENKKRKIET